MSGSPGTFRPAAYAPIPPDRQAFAVRLPRGLVVADHGEPLVTREAADELCQRINEMLGEIGHVIEVERVCPDCGRSYRNRWAHLETCTGRHDG